MGRVVYQDSNLTIQRIIGTRDMVWSWRPVMELGDKFSHVKIHGYSLTKRR